MVWSLEAPFSFQTTKYCDIIFVNNYTYIYNFSQNEGTESWVIVVFNQNQRGMHHDFLE